MDSEWTLSCTYYGPGPLDYLFLLFIVVLAVTLTLWRIFIPNEGWPERNLVFLNLKESSSTSESPSSQSSEYIYSFARTVLTFSFGFLAVEVLQELLSELIR